MENKKDLTKELLSECFKELLETVPFSKITIRMITDKAGLIRPTFYKHFQDKYEVVEWIFKTEVADRVDILLDSGMEAQGMLMLLRCIEKDIDFYKKAYATDGPNSFENLLYKYVHNSALDIIIRYKVSADVDNPILTHETIANYYTNSFTDLVKNWVIGNFKCSADELYNAFIYLISTPALELTKLKKT